MAYQLVFNIGEKKIQSAPIDPMYFDFPAATVFCTLYLCFCISIKIYNY